MKAQNFKSLDVAIVARSCVLPGSRSPEQFWDNCAAGKSFISDISEERFQRFYGPGASRAQAAIQSFLACEISQQDYEFYLQKNNLKRDKSNRLFTYTTEAVRQLLETMTPESQKAKVDIVFGCMNPDSDYEFQLMQKNQDFYIQQLTDNIACKNPSTKNRIEDLVSGTISKVTQGICQSEDNFFSSQVLARIVEKFRFQGEHYLIDAACASSIVAIEQAVQRLRLGQSDLVFSGGIESNLGFGSYIAFSTVGALAKTSSYPFDKRSEGIVQGEGVVLFALKRLEDAMRDGDRVYAVIRDVAGSSDGRSASLFQPDVHGQSLVYKKVYGEDRELSYLEAHGTGTPVGDKTEMESISSFFKGKALPVGSVKSLIGHTKGTAGAAGVLKGLLSIENRLALPSNYMNESLFDGQKGPYINASPVPLDSDRPIRIGVNAFGFGGTNYHLLMEEFRENAVIIATTKPAKRDVIYVAEYEVDLDTFSANSFLENQFPFRIPPIAMASTDRVQLAGLLGAWKCVQSTGAIWKFIDRNKVNVVSACTLFLDQIEQAIHRISFDMIDMVAENEVQYHDLHPKILKFLEEAIYPYYPSMNEDSATGVLNNVIAGRVCNAFDFFGKSYNIDKDLASVALLTGIIENELSIDPQQIFICINVNEEAAPSRQKTVRKSVTVRMLTSPEFAVENELRTLGAVKFESLVGV